MIWRLGVLCATLAATGFGKDVFQPVKRGAIELGAGAGYSQGFGAYGANGDFESYSKLGFPADFSPAAYSIPFSAKYGVGDGVDLKADWAAAFTNKDAGNLEGMTQPRIGIKYAMSLGGAYANLSLPFATGDLDNGNLATVIEVGGIVRKKIPHFRFAGLVSYVDDFRKNHIIRLSAQPEILWTRGLSTYFDVEYLKALNKNADVATLIPGVRTDISRAVSSDIGAGVTLAGNNSPAAWLLKLNLSWTLFR